MLFSYTLNGHSTKYQCFIDLLEAVSVTAAYSVGVYHNSSERKHRYRTSFWKQAFFFGRLKSFPAGLWSMLT